MQRGKVWPKVMSAMLAGALVLTGCTSNNQNNAQQTANGGTGN